LHRNATKTYISGGSSNTELLTNSNSHFDANMRSHVRSLIILHIMHFQNRICGNYAAYAKNLHICVISQHMQSHFFSIFFVQLSLKTVKNFLQQTITDIYN